MKWAHPLKGLTVKERLAEVLSEKLGCDVYADELWLQPPGVSRWHVGIARWGWDPHPRGPARKHIKRVASWDTMKACLRHGFTLEDEGYLCASSNETEPG